MTLRLSVVSEHGIRLGAASSKVFGVHGGTVGRGTDNDWILPDPERYLSGKHLRIDFRAGTYVLVDTSSNGTYINGAQIPLGKYHDYALKDGDYVRLGEYELLVSIDQGTDFSPDASAIVAYDGHAPSSAVKKSTANDLGEELDLSALLEPSDSNVLPRDAYGQTKRNRDATSTEAARGAGGTAGAVASPGVNAAVPGASAAAPSANSASAAGPASADETADGTPWHMMTRPLKVAATPSASAAPTSAHAAGAAAGAARSQIPTLQDTDTEAGLAALCRGAGIDPRSISPEARATALHLAGQLLRESVVGLMDLNHSRNEFRNRFRISAPLEDGPESPLSLAHGADEALVRLLNTLSARAGSVESVRVNFRELKAQQASILAAMHAAFEEFLTRMDPKELEERFERATKRGVFGSQSKGKYWDLFAEMYNGIAQRPPDGFPHYFNEIFGKAYEAKLRTLVPPRRSSFGADRLDPKDAAQAVGDA